MNGTHVLLLRAGINGLIGWTGTFYLFDWNQKQDGMAEK